MDPVQRLFLDSIREYSTNSQAAGGLVDAGSQYQKVLEEEIAKLQRLYGGGDLTSFPNFKFTGKLTIGYLVFSTDGKFLTIPVKIC
uniref:ATP synthase peripheral stalk subunit F6, mitochondrial n=1 Tax=Xiphophorus couchianus TaxID=32473 RepID=A0A3B5LDY2_9TELE